MVTMAFTIAISEKAMSALKTPAIWGPNRRDAANAPTASFPFKSSKAPHFENSGTAYFLYVSVPIWRSCGISMRPTVMYSSQLGPRFAMVFLPVPKRLEDALAAVPPPRGAGEHPRCYFWNEVSDRRVALSIADRMLRTVFKRSGVKSAHAHKFRHTLATGLLARGYTETDVADILGISPIVVRKHYAKWSQSRQERIDEAMGSLHELWGAAPSAPKERVN
jgi:hypothetical protein